MSTTTATIFVGYAHPNDGGINPTHYIQLSENSRPALILHSIDGKEETKVMIPTLENMIDDVYLMIAACVLKSLKPAKEIAHPGGESMYDLFSDDERTALYRQSLECIEKTRLKVVFNIFDGSYLLNKLEQIKRYPADFEITTPCLKKEYSEWTRKVTVTEFKN